MKMQLTSVQAERLRDEIRQDPLRVGEIRRVVGAGEQYIADKNTTFGSEYNRSYTMKIDETEYCILVRLPIRSTEDRSA